MLKLSKKIALPLIAVLLIGTGVGGYFLFKNFQLPKYFVDRYPELLEYCDTEKAGNGLKVSCKALMLDIKPNVSEGTPSLTSLIITNDEELKEYIITEKEDVFAWTNDILQFKKLKPVIINLQYVKKNPITYSIQSITFENIPDTYIQDIVNRDIEEIMSMDKSSTTILNSFDFCPRPETLPDYVIKKEEYAKYWNENVLTRADYLNKSFYTTENRDIKILFGCDSQVNMGYLTSCSKTGINLTSNLKKLLASSNPTTPKFSTALDELNQGELKQISLTYDGTDKLLLDFMPLLKNGDKFSLIKSNSDILLSLIDTINTQKNANEDVFCGTVKLLNEFDNVPEIKGYINKMQSCILENITQSTSAICSGILNMDTVDSKGLYIKNSYTKVADNFKLFSSCINLQEFI